MTLKNIILCADDYSQNHAITQGILSLAKKGRLSATSCMTQSPTWPQDATYLMPWQSHLQIGLHFNLTHPFTKHQSAPLSHIISHSLIGMINQKWIAATLNQQLDLFEQHSHRMPDFVDGHQHVHTFPIIRHIILKTLMHRYPKQKPWIRQVNPSVLQQKAYNQARTKKIILKTMGIRHTSLMNHYGFHYSQPLMGIYTLTKQPQNYGALIQSWLLQAPNNALIMCHPAQYPGPRDPICIARANEFNYLISSDFQAFCQRHNISTN
jgi:chitin disaccharide deacetylase